jgi:hypothetical protein
MKYSDIDRDLARFIAISSDVFDNLQHEVQEGILEMARRTRNAELTARVASDLNISGFRDSRIESDFIANIPFIPSVSRNYFQMVGEYYTRYRSQRITGIKHYHYIIKDKYFISPPERYDFVNIVIHEVRSLISQGVNVKNVTLGYIGDYNRTSWVSFSRRDIISYGAEKLVEMLINPEQFRSMEVFSGSDPVYEYVSGSSINPLMFYLFFEEQVGGCKKKESQYDYYVCLGIVSENNSNNCLINCFKFLSSFNISNTTVRSLLGVSDTDMLGIKHIPKLELLFNINVVVVEDRKNIVFTWD